MASDNGHAPPIATPAEARAAYLQAVGTIRTIYGQLFGHARALGRMAGQHGAVYPPENPFRATILSGAWQEGFDE